MILQIWQLMFEQFRKAAIHHQIPDIYGFVERCCIIADDLEVMGVDWVISEALACYGKR